MVLSLQDGVDLRQPHDQLLLLLLPAEQRRHLLLQVAHDVGVHLREGEESRGEAKMDSAPKSESTTTEFRSLKR